MYELFKRFVIVLGTVIILLIGLHLVYRYHDVTLQDKINSTVLDSNEKEKIIVNPNQHKLTIIKQDKKTGKDIIKEQYFNSRDTSSIIVNKDNSLSMLTRKWGTEHGFFVGLAYSNSVHLDLGCDIFYIHSFDLGLGLSESLSKLNLPNAFSSLGWNCYSNTSLYVKYDTDRIPGIGIKVRF